MKRSLKTLVADTPASVREVPPPSPRLTRPAGGQAQTRKGTRQISAHFKPEVAQALRLLAAEQDREHQDMIAEALNMLFERYGKPTRAEVIGGRRRQEA